MTSRKTHPNKEIEAAIRYAEDHSWKFEKLSGHAWGKLMCPWNDKECRCGTFCQKSIWGTPKVPENMAAQLRRAVDGCVRLIEQQEKDKVKLRLVGKSGGGNG